MNKKIAISLAVCATFFATTVRAADNSGPYIGIGVGLAQIGVDDTDFKESDIGYKAFVGYSFSDLIAFEGAYMDAGNPVFDSPTGSVGSSGTAFNASVLLRARTASSFALYAKVGYAMYDFELTAAAPNVLSGSLSGSDSGLSYGLGVTYTIARKYLVRAEVEGIGVQDGSFNMLTISGGYRF